MSRTQRPAPEHILLAKTTHGTWIALEEEWDDKGRLMKLNPLRREPGGGITQARERRDILAEVERAIAAKLSTQLRKTERELRQARDALNERDGPTIRRDVRYGAAG